MMGLLIIKNYLSLKTIVDSHPHILSYSDIKPFMTKGDLLAVASRRSKEIVKKCVELVQDCDDFVVIDSISDECDYFTKLGMGIIPEGVTLSDFLMQRRATKHTKLETKLIPEITLSDFLTQKATKHTKPY